MTEQRSPSRASDEQASATLQMCPNCEGRGEIGTRQDYWGNWETEQCLLCDGMGEVAAEQITAWQAYLEEFAP